MPFFDTVVDRNLTLTNLYPFIMSDVRLENILNALSKGRPFQVKPDSFLFITNEIINNSNFENLEEGSIDLELIAILQRAAPLNPNLNNQETVNYIAALTSVHHYFISKADNKYKILGTPTERDKARNMSYTILQLLDLSLRSGILACKSHNNDLAEYYRKIDEIYSEFERYNLTPPDFFKDFSKQILKRVSVPEVDGEFTFKSILTSYFNEVKLKLCKDETIRIIHSPWALFSHRFDSHALNAYIEEIKLVEVVSPHFVHYLTKTIDIYNNGAFHLTPSRKELIDEMEIALERIESNKIKVSDKLGFCGIQRDIAIGLYLEFLTWNVSEHKVNSYEFTHKEVARTRHFINILSLTGELPEFLMPPIHRAYFTLKHLGVASSEFELFIEVLKDVKARANKNRDFTDPDICALGEFISSLQAIC